MFQHEELRDAWQDEAQGLSGHARWEEASLSSSAGQKLVQRFTVVENSDISPNGLTALVTLLILASQLMFRLNEGS